MIRSALAAKRRGAIPKHPRKLIPSRAESERSLSLETRSCADGRYSILDLLTATRLVVMITPRGRGSFRQQAQELLQIMKAVLQTAPQPTALTIQTVFLRDARSQQECERLFTEHFGAKMPATSFVIQAPCCGAALAVEAWAISGESVCVEHCAPHVVSVSYDGVRWVHCGGIAPPAKMAGAYDQANTVFQQMSAALAQAGSSFEHVVRTWLYLGGITKPDGATSRYTELNRARADFYRGLQFGRSVPIRNGVHRVYPASTGIGTNCASLAMSCLALETNRDDVFLLPLENPQQTPAYAYSASYSPQAPQFSRAMALVLGEYITTWISGTASIVDSESRHSGDVEAQTEQTIDNIERLIAPENFSRHGAEGLGATLNDLAKIRVYLKRATDLEKCRAICARRFGPVPALYIVADICRPELLVEIEGVAFSKCTA